MTPWTITAIGDVRRERRDDGTVSVFLPGWGFQKPDEPNRGMTANIGQGFDLTGAEEPARVFDTGKQADKFLWHGHTLAELEHYRKHPEDVP